MSDEAARTLFCGNLSEKVTEDILYELFLQAGPLESVTIPKDKGGKPRKYAFIRFKHDISVPYTLALMNGITLYGKSLTLEPRTGAASEHNVYLEKLNQYRQFAHQSIPPNRNYNASLHREPYDDQTRRNDLRQYKSRYESQQDYRNQWNAYPSQFSHYNPGVPATYPAQGRFQNSMPQVPYPHGNRGNWQTNRR